MRTYWQFYWPLALTSVALVLSVQFQNATLARFEEAVTELAVFAFAQSVFGLFNASLNFNAQIANVFARCKNSTATTFRFVLLSTAVIASPLALVAYPGWGNEFVGTLFGTSPEVSERVVTYLRLLTPLLLINALRHYYTGLLIQVRLTADVTTLNIIFLVVVAATLVFGLASGGSAPYVIVGAQALGSVIHLAASYLVFRRKHRFTGEDASTSYSELTRFFVPVSTTGVMFALSRPTLFAFASRLPDGLLTVAALRIVFDFSMLFQNMANQFRHFFVTFGLDEIERKIAFMMLIGTGLTVLLGAFALTPLADVVWRDWMQVPDSVRHYATEALVIMCLMPTVILFRNFYHGKLMVHRATANMAAAAILRVLGIYGVSHVLFELGWLNHQTGAAILVMGFAIEGLVVWVAARRLSIA